MNDIFNSIKSHLDEVNAAVAEVTRGIAEYKRQIAELKPVAESLTNLVEQVNEKKTELADCEVRLQSVRSQQKQLLEALQQA